MAKYHVNPTTGNTNICRARTVCPFGGKESHFEGTKQEANRWAEGKTQQEYSRSLPSHKKEEVKSQRPRRKSYITTEKENFLSFASQKMNGMRIQEQKEDLLKRAMGNHKHSETKYFYGEDAKKHPAYQKLVKNLALIDSKKRSERDLSRIPKNKEGFYIIENKNGVGVSRKDSAYDYTSLTYVEASPLTADDFNKKAEESVEKYIDLFGEYSVGTKEEQVNRLAEILKENTSGVDELISAYEFEKNVTNRKEYSQKLTIQSRDERRKRSSDYEDKVEASFVYLRRANALNKEKEKVQQEMNSLEKLTKESSIHERTSYASIESNNATIENYDHAISNYTEAFRELNPDSFSPEEYKSILASNQDRRAFERNVKAGRVRLVDNRKFLDKTADKINDFLQNSKVADATFGRLERWLF